MIQKTLSLPTSGEGDIVNITPRISDVIEESGISQGICVLFVTGSTAAVTTIEYEPGVLQDFSRALSIFAPSNWDYAHDAQWGDGNGRSHVKASLVGPSLTVPVTDGKLMLGTWQQIVLLELDTRPRVDRTILVTLIGE